MTEEAQIRSVALFFYFSLLDEPKAREATFKSINKIKRINKGATQDVSSYRLINYLDQYWKMSKKFSVSKKSSEDIESIISLPKGIDFGPWKQFKKEALEDEFLTVIFSKILCFSTDDIARGLNLSEGTIRYRLNRGLRMLSCFLKGETA